jgi:hypothetical protein
MKKLILTAALITLALLSSCDVDRLMQDVKEPVIEKTTLAILNLPENISGENLKQINVGSVALCDNPAESALEGTTALVPLVSPGGARFTKTGVYMIQLVIENPDKTLLRLSDIPVEFENGYGTLDLSKIETEKDRPRGLAILNLPPNTINTSFKTLTIGNTAKCDDFKAVEIEDGAAVAPLQLNNGNGEFKKTGVYIVSLTLDVDSLTHLEISAEDRIAVEFIDGRGVLDLADYGDTFLAVRYLTILNMPENAEADSFQSVNIGDIAKAMMDEIKIDGSTAVAPIALNNGKEFNKTGTFFISLRVIIDSLNDIDITKDDYVMVKFENGDGVLDLNNLYAYLGKGFLEGDITNRSNFYEAQIKKDTRFEMNGYFYRVITQAPMDNLYQYASLPNTTLYIYAVEAEGNVVDYKYVSTMRSADDFIRFRISAASPVYSAEKNGWYNGGGRALWKFIKIDGEWRYKTDVSEGFKVENQVLASPIGNILHKWENVDISPAQIWLEPGVYCFEAAGAKGGDSASYETSVDVYSHVDVSKNFDITGGEGGRIIELVSIETRKLITVYTGKAGAADTTPVDLGNFKYTTGTWGGIITRTGFFGSAVSGGGGGAGSFISYDLGQPGDYLLCAGGGAGAAGEASIVDFNSFYYKSSGGAGGSVDRGGNSGGIPVMRGYETTVTLPDTDGGYYTAANYSVDMTGVQKKNPGGGASGIGNVQMFGKTEEYDRGFVKLSDESNKELLTEYVSTIGIGGKPAPLNSLSKPEDFAGGPGGNNRNAVRGGNSGDGYVRIYSLN